MFRFDSLDVPSDERPPFLGEALDPYAEPVTFFDEEAE
jgi:hypothetical protein